LDFAVKPLISKCETRPKNLHEQLVFPRLYFDYPQSMSQGLDTDTTQCQYSNRRNPYYRMTGRAAEITFH